MGVVDRRADRASSVSAASRSRTRIGPALVELASTRAPRRSRWARVSSRARRSNSCGRPSCAIWSATCYVDDHGPRIEALASDEPSFRAAGSPSTWAATTTWRVRAASVSPSTPTARCVGHDGVCRRRRVGAPRRAVTQPVPDGRPARRGGRRPAPRPDVADRCDWPRPPTGWEAGRRSTRRLSCRRTGRTRVVERPHQRGAPPRDQHGGHQGADRVLLRRARCRTGGAVLDARRARRLARLLQAERLLLGRVRAAARASATSSPRSASRTPVRAPASRRPARCNTSRSTSTPTRS